MILGGYTKTPSRGTNVIKPPVFLDNKRHKVVDELKVALTPNSKLSVVSAYFTIYAYQALKKELSQIEACRFIFTEPSYVENREKEPREYFILRNPLSGNNFELKLRNEMKQAAIARECAAWVQAKGQYKSLRKANPAHPRLIHVSGQESIAINGSVDFTTDGLGIVPSERIDYNTCMYGAENTNAFLQMFDELWNDTTTVEDITQSLIADMQVLYRENAPELIYYLMLYHIFYNYLDELNEDNIIKSGTGFKNTKVWQMLYKFQRDGVQGIIDKIEKYNGCILADSVGLGKTFSALAVIKYYELRNDRVLVLCPKRLRENWTIYTLNDRRNILVDDRFNYDVLNHTDLSRIDGFSGDINLATINWGNYDLVIIDESHNFRNNPPVKDRVTRYERMMRDVIKSGVKTKVLMLSATPVNNRMNDIKNQIAFITEGDDQALDSIGLPSIERTLRRAQAIFNQWNELPEAERTSLTFVDMMEMDYFKLLDTLTIARSRKHIEKYYDIKEVGEFPKRLKPINRYSQIDSTGVFPSIGKVNELIQQLSLAVYSPILYLLPDKRREYEETYDIKVKDGQSTFRQSDRERSLVALMRVNILKRLESSVYSFALTVERILEMIDRALEIIEKHGGYVDPDLSILDIDPEDQTLEELMTGMWSLQTSHESAMSCSAKTTSLPL
jgi:SNF2 family DNA or RNA helicase